MSHPFSSILLATNLKPSCRQAFEIAAALAIRHQAALVLVHVLEQVPDYVQKNIETMLGKSAYEELSYKYESKARNFLIGKKSSNQFIHEALEEFCTVAGINDITCEGPSRHVVVTEGHPVGKIIETAQTYNCDLIIMGAREGFLVDNAIGSTIKAVMRSSRVPVMMVPPLES